MLRLCLGFLLCGSLAACSSRAVYESGRNAQRHECMKKMDTGERERCLEDANTPYDVYSRDRAGQKEK